VSVEEERVMAAVDAALAERREYRVGTRVVNCVEHSHRPLTNRPRDCGLCLTDITNQLSLAISINVFLNQLIERIAAARNVAEGA